MDISSKTTINTLSAELLSDIFLYLYDDRPTWTIKPPIVAQVCRWWRQVAFLAKELWCTVPVRCDQDRGGRIFLAELYVERGGDRPLTFMLGYQRDDAIPNAEAMKLVRANANRVRSLHLFARQKLYHCFDWLGVSGAGAGEASQAWPSLESCRFCVEWPWGSLSCLLWPNPSFSIPFPSKVCAPNLREFKTGGGIFPFNFDIDQEKIRDLDIDFDDAENARGFALAKTVSPKIFENHPNLRTFRARLSPTLSAVRHDSPFALTVPWTSQGIGQHTSLRALHLSSGCLAELEWIPPLPRLQRLQLEFRLEKEFASPFRRPNTDGLFSFLRRVGGEVEYLSLNIPALSMWNPGIWPQILSLTPKVRALCLSEIQEEDNLERLLNVEITQPALVPFLHTFRWYYDEDAYSDYRPNPIRWTIDPLLEMLRSRGWPVDDRSEVNNDTTSTSHLTSVFVPKPYEDMLVQPGDETRFQEKRMNLQRWNPLLTLEWDEQFYGSYVRRAWEPIGGAMYQAGRGWIQEVE